MFRIKYKLLLTFIVSTVITVLCMLFLVQWSFERGFLQYVNKIEEEIHNNLVTTLSDEFKQHGNWDFLRGDWQRWRELIFTSAMKSEIVKEHLKRGDHSSTRPHFRPTEKEGFAWRKHRPREGSHWPRRLNRGDYRFRARMTLFDLNNEIVIGPKKISENLEKLPIRVDGEIVAYLAFKPVKQLTDAHELRFSQQLGHAFLLIAVFSIFIAVIIILPLSRSLVKPILTVTDATRELASGKYEVRIPINSNDEIGQLSSDFNSLANTLAKNEMSRRQWIADISHELRTPLSVLRVEIEAFQDGIRKVSPQRLESLHKQVMRLNKLINDLYELSLSDLGALSYQKQNIELDVILDASLSNMLEEFNDKNIEIKIDYDEHMSIYADPDRLQQLFTNLLTNSLRYTDENGKLIISMVRVKDKINIKFNDSAPTVTEENLPKLFERLYRVDSSRSRLSGGAGLGLSICKNIVDAHDGKINAATSDLGGLSIHIELPLTT